MSKQQILLIDENDNIIGEGDKTIIHRDALLHRAFSVFIMNNSNELLIQQRAKSKYHSGGLWSNTCCGHFTSDTKLAEQAEQRLAEEMGIKAQLHWIFNYRYQVKFENGMYENELVYTYVGFFEGEPLLNIDEAQNWRWITQEALLEEIQQYPENFTYWFRFVINEFLLKIKQIQIE